MEMQGIRPHTQLVLKIIVSSNAQLLASASEDLTVFLVKLVDEINMEPIGFISVGTNILNIYWSVSK